MFATCILVRVRGKHYSCAVTNFRLWCGYLAKKGLSFYETCTTVLVTLQKRRCSLRHKKRYTRPLLEDFPAYRLVPFSFAFLRCPSIYSRDIHRHVQRVRRRAPSSMPYLRVARETLAAPEIFVSKSHLCSSLSDAYFKFKFKISPGNWGCSMRQTDENPSRS